MKTIIALACFAALSAHATNYPPTPTPAPSATAQAGAIAGAAALSASRSSVRNTSTTTSAGGSASITGLMNMQGATLGGGGAGGSVGAGAGALNLSGARIGSDMTVERSAPSIYGATPTQPTQPCARPGFSIGGSSKDGSGLISIPTGTDVTCRVDNALTIMSRNPALFTADDRLRVSCKQEDIAETATCKALAEREARKSAGTAQAVTSASLELLP